MSEETYEAKVKQIIDHEIENAISDETLIRHNIPEPMWGGMRRYLIDHIMPGSFLRAIFENSLVDAIANADDHNAIILNRYAGWLYNELPGRGDHSPWGSPEVVKAWAPHG